MASFHKQVDENGRTKSWYVMYDAGTRSDGRRFQKKKRGFNTRKEAEKWWVEEQRRLNMGLPPTSKKAKMSVGEWLERYMADNIRSFKTAKTDEGYRSLQRRWTRELGHIRLVDLSASHIQSIINKFVDDGMKAQTIRNYCVFR